MFRVENPINTIVIGAGPSGLAAGYHLKQRHINYLIVEGSNRVANSWHYVWKDFRLAQKVNEVSMGGLNLHEFGNEYRLTRDEIIYAFEKYTREHQLKIKFNTQVNSVHKDHLGNFIVLTTNGQFTAENVVFALGARQQPKFPDSITAEIQQRYQGMIMHSAWYQNPESFSAHTNILVVGSGLSALSIAKNLADQPNAGYNVSIACAYSDHEIAANNHHLPTIPVSLAELEEQGVENYGKFLGLSNNNNLEFKRKGKINLHDCSKVIFATGYSYTYDLLFKLLESSAEKILNHDNGITEEPGLYVVGLPIRGEKTVTITQGNLEAENVTNHISQKNSTQTNFIHATLFKRNNDSRHAPPQNHPSAAITSTSSISALSPY